jgi:membrane associated rhomboid family serine protease
VWGYGRVWTLATSALLETNFVGLLLHGLMLFLLIPTLERFWGTARFLRFAAITSLLGTLAGTALGLAIGSETGILGLTPFIYGAVVAFGIIYARSPVQIFGVLPLTGRQMMYGFIGFQVLSVVLQAQWAHGAALAAAMGGAALMTSKSWNPGLAWKRWRIARARAHLSMVPPPRPPGPPPGRGRGKNDEKWLN